MARGIPCGANLSAEEHYSVAKVASFGKIEQLAQRFLYTGGVFQLFGVHSEPSANSDAVRVAHNSLTAENVTYN